MKKKRATEKKKMMAVSIPVTIITFLFCSSFAYGADANVNEQKPDDAMQEPTYELPEAPKATPSLNIVQLGYELVESNEHEDIKIEDQTEEYEEQTVEYELMYTEQDVEALAQMAYGEAWVTQSDTEMSACMWSALNRLDSADAYYDGCESVKDIVSQDGQYHGYRPDNPLEERLMWLAKDVLDRWQAEKNGETDVGRTLPKEFCYFWGDGVHNHFTTEHNGGGIEYGWWLESPYDN